MSMAGNIGYGVCALEYALGESAVVCLNDLAVAKSLSNFRPNTQILFFTSSQHEYNQATLFFGVKPIFMANGLNVESCLQYVVAKKLVKRKTDIILVGGNTIKVIKV